MMPPCTFLLGALVAVVASAQFPGLAKIDPGQIAGVVKSAEETVKQTLPQKGEQDIASEVAKEANTIRSQEPSVAGVVKSAEEEVANEAEKKRSQATSVADSVVQGAEQDLASEAAKEAKNLRSQASSVADNVAQSAEEEVKQKLSQKKEQDLASEVANEAKNLRSQAPSVADNVVQSAEQNLASEAAKEAKNLRSQAPSVAGNVAQSTEEEVKQTLKEQDLTSEAANEAKNLDSQAPSVADDVAQSMAQAASAVAQTAEAAKTVAEDVQPQQQVGAIGGPLAPAAVVSEVSHEVVNTDELRETLETVQGQINHAKIKQAADVASETAEAVKPMMHTNWNPKNAAHVVARVPETRAKPISKIDTNTVINKDDPEDQEQASEMEEAANGLGSHWQWSLLVMAAALGGVFVGWKVTKRRDARSPHTLLAPSDIDPQ